MGEPVLCYVKGNCAWFTTQALEDQWGDDWNDAPYEHNAGDPYYWYEGCGKEKWELMQVFFTVDMQTPSDMAWSGNSAYSVQAINNKYVAWLVPYHAKPEARPIFAGVTISEFRNLIWLNGGDVYERVEREK